MIVGAMLAGWVFVFGMALATPFVAVVVWNGLNGHPTGLGNPILPGLILVGVGCAYITWRLIAREAPE